MIEIYADCIQERGHRFAFVTGDRHDFFSMPRGDKRLPHPDIANLFSKKKSLFFGSLHDAIRRINPSLTASFFDFEAWEPPVRSFAEISDAIDLLFHQVWYNRHQVQREKIEEGITKIVEKETFPIKDHDTRPIQRDVWEQAKKAARRVEQEYGIENLGPWDDFDWGMVNGKLSALRWVFGDEWDMLDT